MEAAAPNLTPYTKQHIIASNFLIHHLRFSCLYIFCCSFSYSEMLKQCAKRACYNTLQKHDLLTPLPFKDNQFDCLLSVAVTTYLSKNFESFLIFGNDVGLLRTLRTYACLCRNLKEAVPFKKVAQLKSVR